MSLAQNIFKKLTALAIGLVLLSGCEQTTSDTEEAILRPVRTVTVEPASISRLHEFPAVVEANRSSDLSFKVSGELIEILVKEGDKVVEGQVLAKLNDTDIKLELDEAKSNFDKNKAEFERARELIKRSIISQADFEKAQATFNSAKVKLEASENKMDYTNLRASFSGVIAKVYIDAFQELNAKTPVIALHDISTIDLRISVPERIMIRARKDQNPPDMSVVFDELSDKEFPLIFKEVATKPNAVTKTYDVSLSMEAVTEFNILPGMTARVIATRVFPEEEFVANYYLPAKSVLKDSTGQFVYAVKQIREGVGEIQRIDVNVGEITSLGIEVFSGINVGDQILTAGMSKAFIGMEVKL